MASRRVYPWTGQSVYHMIQYLGWKVKTLMELLGINRQSTLADWKHGRVNISTRYKRELTRIAVAEGYPFSVYFSTRTGEAILEVKHGNGPRHHQEVQKDSFVGD